MRRLPAVLLAFALAVPALAATPDPLRLLPKEANLVLKVERPRALVETVTKLDSYDGYLALPQVREAFESTTAKQFLQFLKHAEEKLGDKWPALLDKLAGGGIAVGTAVGVDNGPFLLVMQGDDEKLSGAAFGLIVTLLNDELARQAGPAAKLETGEFKGAEVAKLGDGFFLARSQAALLVSNNKQAMEKALALAAKEKGAESVLTGTSIADSRTLIGGDPLAWFWFDLKPVKETQAAKDFFESSSKEFLQTVVVGSTIDAVRRADYVAAGLFATDRGLKLSIRLPAKRAELGKHLALHSPADPTAIGTLPLLEPPGVLFSQSVYLDLRTFWADRKTVLNPDILKDIEKGANDVSKFLPNTSVGKLLDMSGVHHRFVMVERGENPYRTQADYPLPEMAIVSSMRDAKFGKQMSSTLRSAALLLSLNLGMKMSEEAVGDITVTSYKFTDEKPFANDPTNLRLNFVPSFAVVNDSLVVASSPRLVKDLIPELQKAVDAKKCSTAVWRGQVYGKGLVSGMLARPDTYVSDAVLTRGVGLEEAKKEVEQYARYLGTLGTASLDIEHTTQFYRWDIEWKNK